MGKLSYREIQETDYPAVRLALREDLRSRLDDDAVEGLLAELFPATAPEDVENFLRTLRKVGRTVAPIAQRALPGMMQGAMQGGMVAGPWGALAGALGGGAASVLAGGGGRPAPQARRAAVPTPTPQPPMPVPAVGAASGAAGGGAAALPQLLLLLSRPETMQALSSMLMSGSGRPTVPVGNRQVPAAAFANAIAEAAAGLAEGAAGPAADSLAEHLVDAYGNPRCDVANPAARASLLTLDLANVAAAEAATEDDEEEEEDFEWITESKDDVSDDPVDAYEKALEGRGFY